MASYKLTENAELDLIRIHQRGVLEFGEQRADEYYWAFFSRFEQIAEQPMSYPAVDDIRPGYRRSVCGVDSIYYRVDDDQVVIVAIIGRQDIDDWL